jgi:hypothetical protein
MKQERKPKMLKSESITISVHLGTGDEGELRKQTLEALAAQTGHIHNGKPSIGRWIVAQADQWIEQTYQAIKQTKGK